MYLSHAGMLHAVQVGQTGNGGYCTACFDGRYPVRLEDWWVSASREKLASEGVWDG